MNQCKTCCCDTTNRIYCSNTCKFTDPEWKQTRKRKHIQPDLHNELTCNMCSWKTNDVNNLGGHATKHLRDCHSITATEYKSYYTIAPKPVVEHLSCPYCEWKTVDINNKSGQFTTHLMKMHGKTPHDTYTEYPEYESLWLRFKEKHDKIEADSVTCQVCNGQLEKISNTHLATHGLTMQQYKTKYPAAQIINSRLSALHSEYSIKHNATREYTYRSKAEQDIELFIRSLNVDVVTNDKHLGFELDLYMPEYRLAIEYNGLRWHSEFFGKKDKRYHISKTNKCTAAGIRLIHVFEDEWSSNPELIKNKIKHILGKSDHRIYARKCVVRQISNKQSAEFCNLYHVQGTGKGYLHVGIFWDNELVGCMQLSRLRRSLNQQHTAGYVEIIRYCTKYSVIGGFSKIIKSLPTYDDSIRTIVSYADKRWTCSKNNIYNKSGFSLVKDSGPNYWYIRGSKRLHRYNFTKSRIVQQGADPSLSEIQNMVNMGYDRIWDCGTLKYEYNFT